MKIIFVILMYFVPMMLIGQRKKDSLQVSNLWIRFKNDELLERLEDEEKKLNFIINITKKYPDDENFAFEEGKALRELAFIKKKEGDYAKAVEYAQEVIQIAPIAKSKNLEATAYFTLGDILKDEKKYVASIDNINKSLEIQTKLYNNLKYKNNPDFLSSYAATFISLADSYSLLTKEHPNYSAKAIENYLKAIHIAEESKRKTDAYINLGQHFIEIQDYPKALYYNELASQWMPKNYEKANKARQLDNIGYIYQKKKDFEKALKYYQESLSFLINFKTDDTFLLPPLSLFSSNNNHEYATTLLKDKADCLLEFYKSSKKTAYLEASLATYVLLDSLIDDMRKKQSKGSKLFWRGEAHNFYENALETCLLLNDTEKAYQFMEKSRAVLLYEELTQKSDSLSRTQFLPSDSLQMFINQRNQHFVEYFLGNDVMYALVFYPHQKARFTKLAISPNEFHDYSDKFLAYCATEKSWFEKLLDWLMFWKTNDYTVAYVLYNKIFEPLNIPQNAQIVIAFDGLISSFDAFLTENDEQKEKFLINYYSFSYAYSASVYFKKHQNNMLTHYKGQFLGISPEIFPYNAALEPLAKIDAKLTNCYQGKILKREKADSVNVFAALADYQIIEFFTHGGVSEGGYIALFDKKVHLQNSFKIKAQLVVLTACETARGKEIKGEGVMSFARNFSTEGVPSTIAALWQIPATKSARICHDFFCIMQKGIKKDEALRQAKLMAMQKNHVPNTWAGLVLIGTNDNIKASF